MGELHISSFIFQPTGMQRQQKLYSAIQKKNHSLYLQHGRKEQFPRVGEGIGVSEMNCPSYQGGGAVHGYLLRLHIIWYSVVILVTNCSRVTHKQ